MKKQWSKKKVFEYLGFVFVLAIASITRLWNLSFPQKLVFDETYYVKDALSLSQEGHEKNWPEGANVSFESGDVYAYLADPSFVVHPPFGKWLIASGMWMLGADNAAGWRISTAVLGIATVALLMLVAYKLFRSTKLALAAGFLLAIDGMAITMSRTALLDAPLTFFLLLGFLFFLIDNKQSRLRIGYAIQEGKSTLLWFRPWLVLAGLALGAASSIKWSGLYLLAAIGLYVVFSELILRRDSGEKSYARTGLLSQGVISFFNLVPAALAIYLSSWLGWINSSGGYSRNWAEDNSLPGIFGALPNWAQSLWNYHEVIYKFHVNLSEDHSYQSHPITWLLGIRPTAFFYETYSSGQMGCESDTCSSAITALGNPLIWVFATAALVYLVYRYTRTRERVIGQVLLGVGALYLPWLLIPERTVFQFYAVSFLPWMILGLVLVMQILYRVISSTKLSKALVVSFFVLAILVSVFFLPVNIGLVVPFDQWQLRMWLPSWI
jgi:dolichyl-phosphate-mannose--protein O-mannosyl transferase